LRERVRNLFHRPSEQVSTSSYPNWPAAQAPASARPSPYAPVQPALVQPAPVQSAPVQPAPVATIVHRPALDFEVRKAPEELMGHEHDYSWACGYLAYVRTAGGRWVLRYAPLGQLDRYGGSLVLAPTVEMKNFREGDLVRVHGEVLDQGRPLPSLGGAHYRVSAIFMVDRADRER
jgi:hypothetical protein